MQLFALLRMLDNELDPGRCKIHLATPSGKNSPLDEYFSGEFEQDQVWQNQRNFERDFVVSLIALPEPGKWLFVGAYDSKGCKKIAKPEHYEYKLVRRAATDELRGRLVIDFKRSGRASYLLASNWTEKFSVAEIRTEPLQIADFPGFANLTISMGELKSVVRQQVTSWRSALSSVSGVYVITDTNTGRLYVGMASGEDGIWGRWCGYAKNGHGGNKELKKLLRENGEDYAACFQYSILETADTRASEDDIRKRETHWKNVLLTRTHGYNKN